MSGAVPRSSRAVDARLFGRLVDRIKRSRTGSSPTLEAPRQALAVRLILLRERLREVGLRVSQDEHRLT